MPEHPFDRLPLEDGSALLFTPCPGTKGVVLRDSLLQLAEAGAGAVISLTPLDEMERLGVSELPELCQELGLRWFHFPVEDDAAPGDAFRDAWARDRDEVLALLDGQATSAIHCRGGSGRTGLMAALLLLERGLPFEQAMAAVKTLRPSALQLDVHVTYLKDAKSDAAQ
jgi:protein-tyrosine phosphatase